MPKEVEKPQGHVKERKREKDRRSGSAAGTNQKWKYSAVLSFLNAFLTPRKTTSNMVSRKTGPQSTEVKRREQTGEMNNISFRKGSEAEDHHDAPADAPAAVLIVAGPSGEGRAPRGRKRPRNVEREKEREVHERLLEALAVRGSVALPATVSTPLTEDELFLKSLLPSLQRLPTQQKNFVKFEIHKLIYEASTFVLNLEFE
ncbi:uncharacterized protein LOC117483608 [Trematomus bernacchii]|uniref:uncharacterized protein LOC117483608 n=1 Tax=Trematomus bernacchii TaxID=40690 RepID=UPI00146C169B|nr:uncharacterized protein LOC117483608 [Trematomus bernacchii]